MVQDPEYGVEIYRSFGFAYFCRRRLSIILYIIDIIALHAYNINR